MLTIDGLSTGDTMQQYSKQLQYTQWHISYLTMLSARCNDPWMKVMDLGLDRSFSNW
jgi:hypothetical protein